MSEDESSSSSSSTSRSYINTELEMVLELEDSESIWNLKRPKIFQNRNHPLDLYTDDEFTCRYRFTKPTFTYILGLLEDDLKAKDNRGDHLPAADRLLITLRYYATASFQMVLGDLIGIDQSTVCRIINTTTLLIAKKFHQFVKTPNRIQQQTNAQQFYEMRGSGIPRICGLIDGTHIPIKSPGGDNAERFRNRKGWFSINCQLVCNADMHIFDLVARWPGSTHDQLILNTCTLKTKLERGSFGNFFLLGDSGYANKKYLLTPVHRPTTTAEINYNKRHKTTRNLVERCIGVWKKRFPVVGVKMRQKLKNSLKVIVATAVLHNIAIDRGEVEPPEPEINLPARYNTPIASVRRARDRIRDSTVRNEIISYLN